MKITVPIWVELVCCERAVTAEGMHSWHPHTNTTDELVASARAAGWVFAHDEASCPTRCMEAYRERVIPEASVAADAVSI